MLTDWINEVNLRNSSTKPHFIILPMGDNYNTYLTKYIYTNYGMFGFGVGIVGSCAPEEAYSSDYKFAFTPIMKSKESAIPAIELFHKRLGYRKWLILGDVITIPYSLDSIQEIVDEYYSLTGESMQLLEKRCEGDRSNFTGVNCKSVGDCPSGEACLYPLVDSNKHFIYEEVNEINKWMNLAKRYDPDVLLLNVDGNFPSYLHILRSIGYTPKVIMGFTRGNVVIEPRLNDIDNTYVYYTSAFSENQKYGNDNSKIYFGSTDNFMKYVIENYPKYKNESENDLTKVDDDYEYIARGSLIGITIERIIELSSSILKINYDNDELYFSTNPINQIYSTIHNYFTVCEKDDGTITQPCRSACGKCKAWETFFGPVQFDINGMNSELKSSLAQIQSYENYKEVNIVSPSTSPVCNKDGHICTEENGFKDCTCNYITPSPWTWGPEEKSSYFRDSGMLAILHIISTIELIVIICFSIFIYKNQRKLVLYKIPKTMALWLLLSYINLINNYVIIGRPTDVSCSVEAFIYYLALGVFAFTPHFIHKELSQDTRKDGDVMYKEIICLSIYYCLLSISVFISPVKRYHVYDLIDERIVYYFTCGAYESQTVSSYFVWILIIEQFYYFYKDNLKRTKLIFFMQIFYILISLLYGVVLLVSDSRFPYNREMILIMYFIVLVTGVSYYIPFLVVIIFKIPLSFLSEYSITPVKEKKKKLIRFLRNRIYRTHMICFGELINMDCYIKFYYAIMLFERTADSEKLEPKAYEIITKYIENDYVKLTLEIKANIMNHFAAVTMDIFRESKEYTYHILLNQFWDKFTHSPYYEMALTDQIQFRYMETRPYTIGRSIEISLGVSIMLSKLSQDEKDAILSIHKPHLSMAKMSRNSRLTKSRSRVSRISNGHLTSTTSDMSLKTPLKSTNSNSCN